MIRRPPRSTLFPTRRSSDLASERDDRNGKAKQALDDGSAREGIGGSSLGAMGEAGGGLGTGRAIGGAGANRRSEEHTAEIQSRPNIGCRLLLEKKKNR